MKLTRLVLVGLRGWSYVSWNNLSVVTVVCNNLELFKSTQSRNDMSLQFAYAHIHFQARIYKEGLSQLASGEAVFKWLSPERGFPVSAGTFNHRAEALYRACAEQPDHPLVSNAVSKGLKRVKMMNFDDAPTSLYDLVHNCTMHHYSQVPGSSQI